MTGRGRVAVGVGVAGTAKNTGKTTALLALMSEARKAGGQIAVTGIGYDGESVDSVTALPKPRVFAEAGELAAVAERCLPHSRAGLEIIKATDIMTALGRVLIARVEKPGLLLMAGPTKRAGLRAVLDELRNCGAETIFVDGALSRVTPLCETDCLILATGAARHTDIDRLAAETALVMEILSLPETKPRGRAARFGSVLGESTLDEFFAQAAAADTLLIEGVIGERQLAAMAGDKRLRGKLLMFADPMRVLSAGDIVPLHGALGGLECEAGVAKAARALAVTVNPYYPLYRRGGDYEPAYVDKAALLDKMRAALPVPCFDVADGGGGLYRELERFIGKRPVKEM